MNETSESVRFAARLSLHEFLIEQLFANLMLSAPNPVSSWDELSASLINAVTTKSFAPAIGTTDPLEIQSAAISLTENFCAKVRQRLQDR